MKEKKNTFSSIIKFIFLIILIYVLILIYKQYKIRNFGDFVKAEYNMGLATFARDENIKYSDDWSYRIESSDFNDAIFYKEITVVPNTAYRVTCMVKTENVITQENITDAGAQISILDTTEQSKNVTGTNDWQKLEFIFDSKNREKLSIGFRLGGNLDNAKGTAWFTDFKLEQGRKNQADSDWNFGCFIFKNVDVTIEDKYGKNENLSFAMSMNDVDTIRDDITRFRIGCEELSNNQMDVQCDIKEIDTPITSISYSDEHGYYIDPIDVKDILEPYINETEYDHIFVIVRLGDDELNKEIPVNDWIGLGRNGFI